MIRQPARQHPGDGHVNNVGTERQDAAVLEHQRLYGQDGGHGHRGRRRPQRIGQQSAAHQVPRRADSHREVDHLGGEYERAHHP